MNEMQLAVDLGRGAILLAMKLALPVMLAALVVGLVVAILQAATQVQEQTLSIVPRLVAAGLALLALLPWMISSLVAYAKALFADMAGWLS